MPPLRAIGHLIPLRSPARAGNGTERAKNLLDHHQFHHPQEPYLKPVIRQPLPALSIAGYKFYGKFIETARSTSGIIGGLGEVRYMRISEVAALVLEQAFGKAATTDEVFIVPWGMPENRSQGRIFWDTTHDRIIARTKEGYVLAVEGTNLVEAAVYLPRMYEELKLRSVIHPIPEGVDMVEMKIAGQEEWSLAASPLHIKCQVPNLTNIAPFHIDLAVRTTLSQAIANRRQS